jgi:hypothetical protein
MSIDKSEVKIYATHDEFCEKHGIHKPRRVEFDRSKISQSELGVIKEYFSNLCTDLTLYADIFTDSESARILNEFNSIVFCRIQKSYLEKLCLSIACLLDPAQTGNNKNLSLARIIGQCECPELDKKLSELKDRYISTGIQQWRHKLLAHNDLGTLMGTEPLELKFEHDDIEDIVTLIQEIFDDISDPTVHTDIRVVLPFDMDGSAFIKKLRSVSE